MHPPLFWKLRALLIRLFPDPPEVRRLSMLTPAELISRVTPTGHGPYPWCTACVAYSDPRVRRMIWEIKYRANPRLTELAAALLADEIIAVREEDTLTHVPHTLVLPVPLTPSRRRERGWNQSELLTSCVLSRLPAHYERAPELLERSDTPPQTGQEKKQDRIDNVRDSFRVLKKARSDVRGAWIILIDDVSTTGATLKDARRALKEAGAKRVEAFVVAH